MKKLNSFEDLKCYVFEDELKPKENKKEVENNSRKMKVKRYYIDPYTKELVCQIV